MRKIIEMAHFLLSEKLTLNDVSIDFTMGRGFDTLFLSKISKEVYAFDIQDEAIESTTMLLKQNNITNCHLIKASHETFDLYFTKKFKGAIFNLGYLPKGSKKITTESSKVLACLKKCLDFLMLEGIIIIVLYPGCESGKQESIEIEHFLKDINQKDFDIVKYNFINQINEPPYLIAIEKRR